MICKYLSDHLTFRIKCLGGSIRRFSPSTIQSNMMYAAVFHKYNLIEEGLAETGIKLS